MKVVLILLGLIFFPFFVNADGYLATQQWWTAVERQSTEYSEYIKGMYDRKGSDFCNYLRKIHPKSTCGSTILLNLPPAQIKLDKNFMVTQVILQKNRLKNNYIFQRFTSERLFIAYLGRNKITLQIDGEEGPRYIQATLPDVVLRARRLAKAKMIKMPRHFYLYKALNEIYKYRYSQTKIDMHQFMTDIITDKKFCSEVFSNENLIRYLTGLPLASSPS